MKRYLGIRKGSRMLLLRQRILGGETVGESSGSGGRWRWRRQPEDPFDLRGSLASPRVECGFIRSKCSWGRQAVNAAAVPAAEWSQAISESLGKVGVRSLHIALIGKILPAQESLQQNFPSPTEIMVPPGRRRLSCS
jgi:hypothetical protein